MNRTKIKRLFIIISLIALFQPPFALSAVLFEHQNSDAAVEEYRKEISNLLFHEDFDTLEEIADELRSSKERFETGEWKLDQFYAGFKRTYLHRQATAFRIYEKKMLRWAEYYPDSLTQKIAQAEFYYEWAQFEREASFTDTATRKRIRRFQEKINLSLALLEEGLQLKKKDPHLYVLLLKIKNSPNYSNKNLFATFEQGQPLDPSYFPLYAQMLKALLGSHRAPHDKVKKFIQKYSLSCPEDIQDEFYARMANQVRQDNATHVLEKYNFSWERIKKGYQDIRKKYPQDFYSLNAFAWFACAYRDQQTAKTLFEEIGNRWEDRIFDIWVNLINYSQKKNWALMADEASATEKTIHELVNQRNYLKIDAYIEKGGDLNKRNNKGDTPLILAIKNKDRLTVNYLLEHQVNIFIPDDEGFSPIHHAAWAGLINVFKNFVKLGADVNTPSLNIYQWRPIHCAASSGHPKIIEYILAQENVLINARIDSGATALHYAADRGDKESVELLLNFPTIKVNIQDKYGFTPLHNAVIKGNTDITVLLIQAGADIHIKNKQGISPFDLAKITSPEMYTIFQDLPKE